MTNKVELIGYVTESSVLNLYSGNPEITLNVPKENNAKKFNYIPIATNGHVPNNNPSGPYLNLVDEVCVKGKLETYTDSYGSKYWHVSADSITNILPRNPFALTPPKPSEQDKNDKNKDSKKQKKSKK